MSLGRRCIVGESESEEDDEKGEKEGIHWNVLSAMFHVECAPLDECKGPYDRIWCILFECQLCSMFDVECSMWSVLFDGAFFKILAQSRVLS